MSNIHGPPVKSTSVNLVTTTEQGTNKRGLDVTPRNEITDPLYVYPVTNTGATLTTSVIAHTITSGQLNTWQTVPVTGLLNVFQVDVYDSTNTFPINIAYRITNSNVLEILSQSANTYTLRIIGAN
jgi:hypothetical protein